MLFFGGGGGDREIIYKKENGSLIPSSFSFRDEA